MTIKLKGGYKTQDVRLDRLVEFDERSRAFPIRALVQKKKPRSYTWRCNLWLDQKQDGACVGFGIAHELAARPAEAKVSAKYAKENIYWEAQKIDEWNGGSYPGAKPFYEGTSVLAGVRVAHQLGWMAGYRWGFSLNDLILGVGYNGPAVLGLNWYEGMMQIDAKGFIRTTGRVAGGHCILCVGVNVKQEYFTLHNSWGKTWGLGGRAKISFSDMRRLMKEDGEQVFFVARKSKL